MLKYTMSHVSVNCDVIWKPI